MGLALTNDKVAAFRGHNQELRYVPEPTATKEVITETVQLERRFMGWVGGIAAALFLLGTSVIGSLLWNMNSSLVSLKATNETNAQATTTAINGLQSQVTAFAADRYSKTEAGNDRLVTTRLIDGNTSRLNDQDKVIRELAVKVAEMSAKQTK